jgi:hypothetical protein
MAAPEVLAHLIMVVLVAVGRLLLVQTELARQAATVALVLRHLFPALL